MQFITTEVKTIDNITVKRQAFQFSASLGCTVQLPGFSAVQAIHLTFSAILSKLFQHSHTKKMQFYLATP